MEYFLSMLFMKYLSSAQVPAQAYLALFPPTHSDVSNYLGSKAPSKNLPIFIYVKVDPHISHMFSLW